MFSGGWFSETIFNFSHLLSDPEQYFFLSPKPNKEHK
tara:strand:- start:758 stop:868 length:111 start_codon:yes stop_codon:yes gene_type:complete